MRVSRDEQKCEFYILLIDKVISLRKHNIIIYSNNCK